MKEGEMGDLIKFKLLSKTKEPLPLIQGDFCFYYKDVELIECGAEGNAIIHFKSGRCLETNKAYESVKELFIPPK